MKTLRILLLVACLFAISQFVNVVHATYDPLSAPNNKFGIHILFPAEVSDAAPLVNSSGGDWGYVTIPIQASDRNLDKWQAFMDDCARRHLIPIIRLATTGDYFVQGSWSEPSDYDVLDFANFLNSLNWPTKNRYVVIFNEPNRGDEWGGTPDPATYADILDYATKIFKQTNPNFFVIAAGLDNGAANVPGQSIDEFTFMQEMNNEVPGIFAEVDGLASHSYPNPGFTASPSTDSMGIYSFYYQNELIYQLTGKKLPVFITETGWTSDKVSDQTQSDYYTDAFANYWNDPNVVAVTPFLLRADSGPFTQFTFLRNGNPTAVYSAYKNLAKVKGQPQIDYVPTPTPPEQNTFLPIEKFNLKYPIQSIQKVFNKSSEAFFKWLLGA
ncbi:MAG: hypothetical protein ABSE17_02035 [Candidatus Levyibacteriota bacterium]|jgi:hypothetical protein